MRAQILARVIQNIVNLKVHPENMNFHAVGAHLGRPGYPWWCRARIPWIVNSLWHATSGRHDCFGHARAGDVDSGLVLVLAHVFGMGFVVLVLGFIVVLFGLIVISVLRINILYRIGGILTK